MSSVVRCTDCGAAVAGDWTCATCGVVVPAIPEARRPVSFASSIEDVDESTSVTSGPSLWDEVNAPKATKRRRRRLGANFWIGLGLLTLLSGSASVYVYGMNLVEKNQQALNPPPPPAVTPAEHVEREIAETREVQRLYLSLHPDVSGTPFEVAPGKTTSIATKAVSASEHSTIRVTVRDGKGYCVKITNSKAGLTGGVTYYDSGTDLRTDGAPQPNGACVR